MTRQEYARDQANKRYLNACDDYSRLTLADQGNYKAPKRPANREGRRLLKALEL
jgi:hypothetical protein